MDLDLHEIRLRFPDRRLSDIPAKVRAIIGASPAVGKLPANAAVAITAGSRGIANLPEILREIVRCLRSRSLAPYLVPAMGSHGGATAEGQLEVLRHLGITEQTVEAPIRSSMEVELLGHTPDGLPVYMDKHALQADGIIVVNRIKAHTAFRGTVESGLSKMIAIGLGKITGASHIHNGGVERMAGNIEAISRFALSHARILLGVGIVENGYDETADIAGVEPEAWHEKEAALLQRSKRMLPRLPVDELDLLLIEQMGKGFSGSGMDPNIIGRWRIAGVAEPVRPRVRRVVVLDLADHSFGNAQGVGLADFTTQTLADKIDRNSTYTSTITSTFLQRAMLPMVFPTDRDAFEAAVRSLGPNADREKLKVAQIPNTLHLEKVFVSGAVLAELNDRRIDYTLAGTHRLVFDERGTVAVKISKGLP